MRSSTDELDLFYRSCLNVKTGKLKPDVVQLCNEMNIDPDNLKPRSFEEILAHTSTQQPNASNRVAMFKAPGNVDLPGKELARTRFDHYNKRRLLALSCLQMRYEDLTMGRSGSVTFDRKNYEEVPQLYKTQVLHNALENLQSQMSQQKYIDVSAVVQSDLMQRRPKTNSQYERSQNILQSFCAESLASLADQRTDSTVVYDS